MTENLFEAQYDLTKKSKLKRFYDSNKILIYSTTFIIIIFSAYLIYYFENKNAQKKLFSENYIQAKIYLDEGKKIEAIEKLKALILSNDSTYSTLSFFLILNQNLVTDYKEIVVLFDHILNNNKFDEEIRNLLIYKKAVYNSNYIDESNFLKELQPILNSNSLWKPHALLLVGDYFLSKKEYLKAKEFYLKTISIKNIQRDIFDQAKSQLTFINDK